jgi:branched-chain amino acid transport system ATP-binding protein
MTGVALELIAVTKRFGPTEIIRGVDLEVEQGRIHAIIGPNGAGKSTLFNLVSGLLRPTSGAIKLKGEPITGLPPYAINRRGLSRSFQVTNVFPRLSVMENIRCSLFWSRSLGYSFWSRAKKLTDLDTEARRIAGEIGLLSRADALAGFLTYAEQRALEIAITISGGADVILLDEPTAGMSVEEARRVVALIRRIAQGRTVLIIEHDMGVVFDLADAISVLVYGRIIASGAPATVKASPKVQDAYLGTVLQ